MCPPRFHSRCRMPLDYTPPPDTIPVSVIATRQKDGTWVYSMKEPPQGEHVFGSEDRICERCKRTLKQVLEHHYPCEDWYDEIQPKARP